MPRQAKRTDAEVALQAATATTIVPAGACQSTCVVQNKSATDTVFMTTDGSVPSANNGMELAPKTGYEFPEDALPRDAVRVFSTGTPRVYATYA